MTRHPGYTVCLMRRGTGTEILLVLMTLIWGANFSVQKYAFTALTPGGFLFARYLLLPIAAMSLLLWYRRAPLPSLTQTATIFPCLVISLSFATSFIRRLLPW